MSTQLTLENFQQIYNTSYQRVLRYIICKCSNMEDVNDLVQDTYIELYKILKKKQLLEIDNTTNYIIGIAKKRLAKHYGLLYQFSFVSLYKNDDEYSEEIQIPSNFNLEEEFVDKDNIDRVWEYLKQKDFTIFKVFYLFYSEELKIHQIAGELNLTESNVKNILYRNLKEIKSKFKIEGDKDEQYI